jgi:hypothetical protein
MGIYVGIYVSFEKGAKQINPHRKREIRICCRIAKSYARGTKTGAFGPISVNRLFCQPTVLVFMNFSGRIM